MTSHAPEPAPDGGPRPGQITAHARGTVTRPQAEDSSGDTTSEED